jgi:surface antigen
MRAGRGIAALVGLLIPCTSALAVEAQVPYEESIQYALESLTSGISSNSLIGDVAVSVTPIRTWKSVSGHYCREFEIVVAKPDAGANREAGVRCRDGDGRWKPVK